MVFYAVGLAVGYGMATLMLRHALRSVRELLPRQDSNPTTVPCDWELQALSHLVIYFVTSCVNLERVDVRWPRQILTLFLTHLRLRLAWRPCNYTCNDCRPEYLLLLCCNASVPLDYNQPNGRMIALSLVKLPANGTAAENKGSLFFNPGGPGEHY